MKHIRQHTRRILQHVRKELLFVVLMGIVSLALYTYIPHLDASGFESSEVKFADASPSGLSIVPASCPSDNHGGLYSCTCGAMRSCSAGNVYWYYRDGGLCDIEYCTGGYVCHDGTGPTGYPTAACVSPCPTAIESPWGAGTHLLYSATTRRINDAGINVCATNNFGSHYFVPARTNAELQSFINAAAGLGVSIF